eukprot:CAMPEP_0170536166 /NCGR_PEP_ID=MMETSP0209-20121228/101998_1 /TAXON_ID=665100 ORGANISM="Litonotus pictus, Strain P1" /NCGR_SAMPLE_ID=MMETSP0209 /ASSEMBLY_ACC=CAM_ASM_000301 /LENGTH=401 /DNA_ID=CAMNT_0010837503 /DNA_START=407 /DNA_END=1612 /DNA_ORIENTATION=-
MLNSSGKSVYKDGANPNFRLVCGDSLIASFDEGAGLIFSLNIKFTSREAKNNFKAKANPNFRLVCGDSLIASFDEGAGLIFSLNIKFTSREAKNNFKAKMNGKFGSFGTAGADISSEMNKEDMEGTVSITGYQMGGDPVKLNQILSEHVIECNSNDIEKCNPIVEAMIKYSRDDFPNQITSTPTEEDMFKERFVPVGEISVDFQLSDIGMELADSFVTDEVVEARRELLDELNRMRFYKKALEDFEENYPYSLGTRFGPIKGRVAENIMNLEQGGRMYKSPNRAMSTYKKIKGQIDTKLDEDIKEALEFSRTSVSFEFRDRTMQMYLDGSMNCHVETVRGKSVKNAFCSSFEKVNVQLDGFFNDKEYEIFCSKVDDKYHCTENGSEVYSVTKTNPYYPLFI